MIRPELAAKLRPHAELIVFSVLTLAAIWLAFRGGWF